MGDGTFQAELELRVRDALRAAGLPDDAAGVAQASDTRFGDYQSNAAMTLAKREKQNPRALAARILDHLDVSGLAGPPEVAGAGFLNFRISEEALARRSMALREDALLGTPEARPKQRIIIDFSSPNIAKPMHVGHIRSTILGDSLARIARFLGHEVITDNHVGDWGTQFGKVIYGWKHLLDSTALERDPAAEMLRLYRQVNALEADSDEVRAAVRAELVKLQQGDAENRRIWERTVELSWKEFDRLYALLDVWFDEKLGESAYNDALEPLVERLIATGIARESEGAICVFFPEIPELTEKPCLVRKSDGGFLYATTDLATLEYRTERWQPDAVWYVTGAPQALHFAQVFAVARRMGLAIDARHVAFGSILGEDRKIMKTRSGENVQLGDLLREAEQRARALIEEKNPELPAAEKDTIARDIGIGAVKYAELSQHRMTDYVFSWERMLSFQGNTAPYLQNACVRIRSIFRKAGVEAETADGEIAPASPEERALALKICQFGEIVPVVLDDFRPNLLANYLYELAIAFHGFYEACPVLKSEGPERASRMALCALTLRVLEQGLSLLGIRCPQRM